MSFYPVASPAAIPGMEAIPGVEAVGADQARLMVAVPVAALSWPVRPGSEEDGRSGWVVEGAQPVRSGEPVVWCKIVAVTPAVVRRDGRVQAQGRPSDHARLGAAEVELDRRCGPGTVDRIAAGVRLGGKVTGTRQRQMSVALVIRAVLLLTLMPEADAREVLTTLLGDLLGVPWQQAHAVPSPTVLSRWRAAVGPAGLEQLQRELLAAAAAEHDHGAGGRPGIEVGGGLRVGAIEPTVTRMPDTKANREAFGTAGAAEAGYPHLRHLHAAEAFTRGTVCVVAGPSGGDKAEAEQQLLDRMILEYTFIFGPGWLWVMDRNFPGVPRIAKMLATGTHVLIRVKSDIVLTRTSEFAEDGSYLATMSGGGATLTIRVIEYQVSIDGQTTPELFCLVTDLLDHQTHPAEALAKAYRWRWDGSETALREAKSTINGAGPGTGAILRSITPDLVRQEHAAWIIATELVHSATRSAAALARPFTKGPRAGQPVQPRHLSFTTTRRTLLTTVRAGTATASLPAATRHHAHQATLATITTARVTTDRHRHRPHKIKTRQPFGHAPRDITTHTAPATVHIRGTTTAAA